MSEITGSRLFAETIDLLRGIYLIIYMGLGWLNDL